MKTTPMLICIPDISGFTQFMSDTDIELASKVIPSLLNKIIYSNELGLKVSEIEGDAVLFYRSGKLPPFKELIDQCRHFYIQFYKQIETLLKQYKTHKEIKNVPKILGLKIILHYGNEIGAVPIGKRIKLIGEDVITAHRLLKNDVPFKEYLLLSDNLLNNYEEDNIERNFGWGELKPMETEYKHLGEIGYSYIGLHPLVD